MNEPLVILNLFLLAVASAAGHTTSTCTLFAVHVRCLLEWSVGIVVAWVSEGNTIIDSNCTNM